MTIDSSPFARGVLIYPQPIAISCDRICRAKSPQEQVDAILRCAEILTRYLAAISLSSFCARVDASVAPSPKLETFDGNLSFGSFLHAIANSQALGVHHPLDALLEDAFRGGRALQEQAEFALTELLAIRNDLGHDLSNLTEVKARDVIEQREPHALLVLALKRLDAVLSLPLFVIESQEPEQRRLFAQRIQLMGASSDPLPERIELPLTSGGVLHRRSPYVGYADGILNLEPFLLWDIAPKKGNFALHFVHEIGPDTVVYQSVGNDERTKPKIYRQEIRRRIESGDVIPHEVLSPIGTRPFHSLWLEQRVAAEQTGIALIAWNELDALTVEWYGRKLGNTGTEDELRIAIRDQLLDGREFLRADEIRQLLLLFGRPEMVRRLVNRPLIDCRAPLRDSADKRFDRVEVNSNLIAALRSATAFFAEHIGVGGITIENLTARSGSANYIAMREALVNLLIHQDYSNQKMAGQVILEKERATFINPGAALVSQTELIEGNVNQSRNPLLSRALKLIGFAELAGSGLGAIYDAWRGAKRRPPVVESSQERNTFRLTLDWRTLPTVVDKFWKESVGVSLSPVEAATVLLAADSKGTSLQAIAIAHGMRLDDVFVMVRKLAVNEMVVEENGKILVHEKRREQVQQAKAQAEMLNQMLSSPPC